jgi:Cytochrome domain of cellobiose dehydrogenase
MTGSAMVIMWPNTDGSVTLSQRAATGHIMPTVVANPPRVATKYLQLSSVRWFTSSRLSLLILCHLANRRPDELGLYNCPKWSDITKPGLGNSNDETVIFSGRCNSHATYRLWCHLFGPVAHLYG